MEHHNCTKSIKMAVFNSIGSFYNFYPNLSEISFIHKMSKNKGYS